MAKPAKKRPSAKALASVDLDAALADLAAKNVEQLRGLWRQKHGQAPPPAFSRDLIARALAYRLQEDSLGGLEPRLRKRLEATCSLANPPRRVKIGSIIVREHQGRLHEVLVVPGGFCWEGDVFASLSTIARKITGTNWNGPRFFGLRGGEQASSDAAAPAHAAGDARARPRSGSIRAKEPAKVHGVVA